MKDTEGKLSWGILGTGAIAQIFATGLSRSKTSRLVAVASRTESNAKALAQEFNVERFYGSYEAILADPAVEVIYIAVPHAFHAEWTIRAANAGKHVLCEKPLTMTHAEAAAAIDAARRNDVFLMEGFMYRCHPQTAKLVQLIREKAIGDVRVIQGTFSFFAEFDPTSRPLSNSLGGGGILDVGCYPVSMARLLAGAALGKPFADPIEVSGAGHIGKTSRVDEWAVGCLKFPGGIVAQVAAGVHLVQENALRIFGSEGDLYVPSPWVPGGRDPGTTRIFLRKRGEKMAQELLTKTHDHLYSMEADAVATYLNDRQAPEMPWNDSLGNMLTLDRWRKAVGVTYPADLASVQTPAAR